jgi:hypothetical protein
MGSFPAVDPADLTPHVHVLMDEEKDEDPSERQGPDTALKTRKNI